MAGYTGSTNFPGTAGGAQATAGGNADAFVARLNRDLTTLVQATYLGGSGSDFGHAVAVHPTTGDVYVPGQTVSFNFPGTAGGAQAAYGGGTDDAFVARLNSSLTTLMQATYLGGSAIDAAWSLAIHPTTGDVYVGGETSSPTNDFPGTAGGAQAVYAGGFDDAFVARLNRSLTVLVQATYLGGNTTALGQPSTNELALSLAISATTGDVYVTGYTDSANFPVTGGAAQTTIGGGRDAFLARLNSILTAVVQSTFLGGSGDDAGSSVAIHPTTGEVYVAGDTHSLNFPKTAGGAQPTYGGDIQDAFIARLNSSLSALIQATYLGGSGRDAAIALAIRPQDGHVYVAGYTDSANFPGTAGGAQATIGGGQDAFVARLNSGLTSLTQATYLGGSVSDRGSALAIHPTTGDVYVGGETYSTNFPGTAGGAQPLLSGVSDTFVARVTYSLLVQDQTAGPNFAAVLPLSRSVQVGGSSATAFAAIVNSGTALALNCAPAPPATPPAGLGTFTYQTTTPNNVLAGTPNTPADIAPGATQNYVFGFSPIGAIPQTSLAMRFLCDNTAPAPQISGVNNFFIVADTVPVPNTIALISTVSGDGVVRIFGSSATQLFAIGTSNVGATGTIVVSGDIGGVALPLTLTVCETTGGSVCLAPPTPTVTVTYMGGTNRSFAFFAQASGSIPLDPANNRVFARLTQAGVLRGASSAAVCTMPNPGC